MIYIYISLSRSLSLSISLSPSLSLSRSLSFTWADLSSQLWRLSLPGGSGRRGLCRDEALRWKAGLVLFDTGLKLVDSICNCEKLL